jgi:hypothetical protein
MGRNLSSIFIDDPAVRALYEADSQGKKRTPQGRPEKPKTLPWEPVKPQQPEEDKKK